MRNGMERTRLPVAAKIALPSAGGTAPIGDSPISAMREWFDTAPKCTPMRFGASAMRSIGYSW